MAHILMLRKAHFFSIDNDLIDVHAKTIGAIGVAVYTTLARHANRKTGECWPSIGRLAHLLDLARNTVKTALRHLEAAGLITIRRRRDPAGDATSHLYTLLDASPAAVETRLATRRAATTAPDGGRSLADLPLVSLRSTGQSPVDQEPSLSQLTTENQPDTRAEGAGENPPPPAKRPCSHPTDTRSYFGDVTICQHCWTMLTGRDDATREEAVPRQNRPAGAFERLSEAFHNPSIATQTPKYNHFQRIDAFCSKTAGTPFGAKSGQPH